MKNQLLVDYFSEIETAEKYKGYFCSISDAVCIAIIGSLCGLQNVKQLHQWAANEKTSELLKEKFGIKHIPCYFWLLSLLKLVKPESLNGCIKNWAEDQIPSKRKGLTIALDGKTVRSTTKMKRYKNPLHIVSAQLSELGITFASKSVDGKSNEIPAVQELITELDIHDCIIVADALNCQRETAEAIIKGHGDYLLSVKGNQSTLEKEISEYIQDEELRQEMNSTSTTEKNRDRVETRTSYTTNQIEWLSSKGKWKHLYCIGAIRTKVENHGITTEEWHYYISSRNLSASELLYHARMEWAVEAMHWLLDVHYQEDFCRIENRTLQQNLNMLKKFALSLIKVYKSQKNSKKPISNIMFDCLLNYKNILAILEN